MNEPIVEHNFETYRMFVTFVGFVIFLCDVSTNSTKRRTETLM